MPRIIRLKRLTSTWLGAIYIYFLLLTSQLAAQDILGGLMAAGGPEGGGAFVSFKSDGNRYTILKAFTNLGSDFSSNLVQGEDGYLYGTASTGGKYNGGVVFKLLPDGTNLSIIYQFNPYSNGYGPSSSLIIGKDGYLYGTCMYGGPANGYGIAFKVQPDGSSFSVLRSFNYSQDGGVPLTPLTQGSDGYLYGITSQGGQHSKGTLFKMSTDGNHFHLLRHLSSFDGTDSRANLVEGKDGYFYGTAPQGGDFNSGTLFKIKSDGSDFAVIRHCKVDTEGGYPVGGLVLAADGYFYGMTGWAGTLFKVNADGNNFSIVHRFDFAFEGMRPQGSLLLGKNGSIYGMTAQGGTYNKGTLFQLQLGQSGITILRHMSPDSDKISPLGYFTEGKEGNLYGLALDNKIFEININGSHLSQIGQLGGKDGYSPQGDLEKGNDGYLYGVTSKGGSYNKGTIFKVKADGNNYQVIRHLDLLDGINPTSGLTVGNDGYLYGMAPFGGAFGLGTIFRIQPDGSGFLVLRNFTVQEGYYGRSQLTQNQDGYFYGVIIQGGTTGGTIFKMKPDGSNFTTLHVFDRDTEGAYPVGKLVEGSDGSYYGVTSIGGLYSGGAYAGGTIFKISTTGQFQVLRHFNPSTDGERPEDGLVKGRDGYLYGVTSTGKVSFAGGIFKIREDGSSFKVLRYLNANEGAGPVQNLVEGSDGDFYGMAAQGGVQVQGTLFRINADGSRFSVLRYLDSPLDGGWGSLILLKAAPQGIAQKVSTLEDTSLLVKLSAEGQAPFTYAITKHPQHGSLQGTTPYITYIPDMDYVGSDTISFTVSAEGMISIPASIAITVTPVNDAPILVNISSKTGQVGTNLRFTVQATDIDLPKQTLTYTLTEAPADASINEFTGAFSWTPSQEGQYRLMVKISDNGTPSLSTETLILVTVYTPPTISVIPDHTLPKDSSLVAHFTVTDPNVQASMLIVTVATDNRVLLPEGSLLLEGSGTDRTLTIRPATGKTGQAKVTLTVTNGNAWKQTEFSVKVEQLEPLDQVRLAPNPTHGRFSVLLQEKPRGTVHLLLYSPLGKKVQEVSFSETEASLSLNLTDFLPGVYMLKVITEAHTWTRRIVKY